MYILYNIYVIKQWGKGFWGYFKRFFLLDSVSFFGDKIREFGIKLAKEFMACVLAKDFVEPTWIRLLVFGGKDFDDVSLLKLRVKADHLAINNGAGALRADLAMEAISKI